ncbi:proline dehydrogenase family protein [Microbacterium sp. NPDC055903]
MTEQQAPPPPNPLAERAIELVRRWVAEAAIVDPDPAQARLSELLRADDGLAFAKGLVDGVLRPESLTASAAALQRIAPLAPGMLPWHLRGAVRLGGGIAPALPTPAVPIARRVARELIGHLVADPRPGRLGPEIARIRESGGTVGVRLLGHRVLGDAGGEQMRRRILELIERDDVEHVSLAISALVGAPDPWSFDEAVAGIAERMLPIYLAAASDGVAVTLEMEGYRDLDLTIAVFTSILEDPRLSSVEAGITLQTYLPDAGPALRELTAWAQERVQHGGAPITVRLTKGAHLAMEHVDAVMHGWPQATLPSRPETDANHLRILDEALRPERIEAVRIAVAGHNLFDIAYARLLAEERGVADGIEVETLYGMADDRVRRAAEDVGPVRVWIPAVEPAEADAATGYLVRRLEELAAGGGLLAAHGTEGERVFHREEDRFLDAVDRSREGAPPPLRRTQDRRAPVHESARPVAAPVAETDLTRIVLGISRGSSDEPFVETAVYSRMESAPDAGGAPGFENAADTDLSTEANREWARAVRAGVAGSTAGADAARAARVAGQDDVDRVIARTRAAAPEWGSRPAGERADVLLRAAAALEGRRAELIQAAASEAGVLLAEADAEVNAAVDAARYCSAQARELDAIAGAVLIPAVVSVVTGSSASPLAVPAGDALAALAAGSGVVLVPDPRAPRTAAVVAEALWQAGIPRDVLVLAIADEETTGMLVEHPDVEQVVLSGPRSAAAAHRSRRSDLRMLAETGGKATIIVTPSADLDQVVEDIVRSAFARAGQSSSSASLAILVGTVGRSKRFARQLVDATRSLEVGRPEEPGSGVGPLQAGPSGDAAWALRTLEGEEQWLVTPAPHRGDETGRLWSPGIRVGVLPGSRAHLESFAAPVLSVMHAPTLARAIELQNQVETASAAGLHTQDPDDLALWLDRVEAASLFVNRRTTGAMVQRQPSGGGRRSSVGPGAKTGGPNRLIALGGWRATSAGPVSSTLHLRGLDSRITDLVESAQPSLDYERFEWLRRAALSDAIAWDREFGQVRDVSRLEVERNLFRYRPVPVWMRAADAELHELLRVVVAALRAGSGLFLSATEGLPAGVRRALGALGVGVAVESDAEWLSRLSVPGEGEEASRPARIRLVGSVEAVRELRGRLGEVLADDLDVAVYDGAVTAAGRIELLAFVREQSISITAHRFGRPDPWSAAVI